MSQHFELVAEVAASVLGHNVADITPESGVDVTERWDSLQHLAIMMAIEDESGAKFQPEALAEARTVAKICEALEAIL